VIDLDDFKYRIRTEWAKLDYAVIAASVRLWRRRLSGCVNAGGGHFCTVLIARQHIDKFCPPVRLSVRPSVRLPVTFRY